MSQHLLPVENLRRGRFAFTSLRSLAFAAGLSASVGLASAAEPSPPASAVPGFSDVMLARAVLSAIDSEPELRGVNLVVSVVDRVAVIGGAVPSPLVAKRAEKLVKTVEGIKEVRNTCFVASLPDPLLRAVATQHDSMPPRPVMQGLPGVLTNQIAPPLLSPPATNEPSGSKVVALRPPNSAPLLGAPVGAPGSRAVVSPSSASVPATAPGVLTGGALTTERLLIAAGEVRRTDPRFAKLSVEMREEMLVISGQAAQPSDAWDFAKKLRTVPGVKRVVIGTVDSR